MIASRKWSRTACLAAALLLVSFASAAEPPAALPKPTDEIRRIAFGSCARQGDPQPIWNAIANTKPDVFLFLGDIIYGDTTDPEELRRAYATLAAKPEFSQFRQAAPVLATWDDHDYGLNDGGAEHPRKQEAQEALLDFLHEPKDSPLRQQEGVYQSHIFGPDGRRVQIILLDTRYHRGPLTRIRGGGYTIYLPSADRSTTMLGAKQWQWLREQLRKPAEVRLLVSSIQVIPNEHPFEKWGNLPHERKRLLETIRDAKAEGVLLLSGDQHMAEISVLRKAAGYDLIECTSSGMTHTRGALPAPNSYRYGNLIVQKNFGLLEIDWDAKDPIVALTIRGEHGAVLLDHEIPLSRLRLPPEP